MRAVIVEQFGSLDDIRLADIAAPTVKPGHVLLSVKAAAVGYVDVLVALGRYQVKQALPFVPGTEFSGVIEAVGEGVTGWAPGDRVMGGGFAGAWAVQVLANPAGLLKMPAAMSFTEGAIFRTNYATALYGLQDRAEIKPGETLLVLGAGGGTGIAAIQVAKVLGARVIAAASSDEKRQAAKAAGADELVDYTVANWRDQIKALTGEKGVDVVFDPVGGSLTETAFRSLAWKGRHLVIGYASGTIPALPVNLALLKGASLVGVDIARFGNKHEPAKARSNLHLLLDWFEAGKLTLPETQTVPLEHFKAAMSAVLERRAVGKIALQIAV